MRTRLPSILVLAFLVLVASARHAGAFCGFYVSGADAKLFNDATQVVLIRDGTRTVLSMQNSYKGPPENFAMVVPVPVVLQKENVKTLKKEVLQKLDRQSSPRLVEYWEVDPCYVEPPLQETALAAGAVAPTPMPSAAPQTDLGVKIEAQFTVGEYEIVILSAKDAAGLDTWLRREKYKIPEGAEPYLRPYVQAGSKFFVARVDPKKVAFDKDGLAELSPLRFHYDTPEFTLPVRLGLINSGGTQDLVIHILAKNQRYEPANYPSVTIPTNIDVAEDAKDKFGSFYAALFDRTLEKNPKAIVTEYAWGATSCDPCSGPTADPSDFASLGGDALANKDDYHQWMSTPWVLTRLHARYSKESLGQDIVFKAAPPLTGGREVRGKDGALEHGAQTNEGYNNFQARYAIRHPWTGPIACKEPKRGRWGGPPNGVAPAPKAATKVAFAPRGGVALDKFVKSDVSEIGLKAPTPMPASPPVASVSPSSAPTAAPGAPEKKGGCTGCVVAPTGEADARWLGLTALGLLVARGRRRSRPSR